MPYVGPTTYTPELGQRILDLLADGVPLSVICRMDGMPHRSKVHEWRAKYPDEFGAQYFEARDDGFDMIASRLPKIARGQAEDLDGSTLSSGDVQRDKLIIDTDLKLLSKWDNKRYGDKTQVEHSGGVDVRRMLLEME